jgi:hypothetical protein
MTKLLIDFCKGVTTAKLQQEGGGVPKSNSQRVDGIIHLFVDQPACLVEFLSEVQNKIPKQSQYVYHQMIETYLQKDVRLIILY